MTINFTAHGWEDFSYWIETDNDTAIKIKELIKSIKQNPFRGIGKPEPPKHGLKGYWSRRITGEHRLIYKVSGMRDVDQKCTVIQSRFHYNDK